MAHGRTSAASPSGLRARPFRFQFCRFLGRGHRFPLLRLWGADRADIGTAPVRISDAQQTSWITVTWISCSLVSLPLCLYYRQPLTIGWTLPGLLYMGSLADTFTLSEFAAANLLAGAAILAIGIAGLGSRIVDLVPMPILMAMFAASILEYETRLVDTVSDKALIAIPMVAAYVAGRLLNNPRLPPVGLAVVVGAVAITSTGEVSHLAAIHSTLPALRSPGLDVSPEAILTVTVPMVVLVLGLGNVQSLGFMMAQGYKPPHNVVTGLIGGITVVNAVFGGHPASMARTGTAMVSGREAGDLDSRYWAAFVSMVPALAVGLATGFVVSLVNILPAAFIFAMAGLAILGPFQDAMARGFAGSLRLGCTVAFVVTLSSLTVHGIPPAFWALVAGIGASLLLEHHELRRYWATAFGQPHSPIDHVAEAVDIRRDESETPDAIWQGLADSEP